MARIYQQNLNQAELLCHTKNGYAFPAVVTGVLRADSAFAVETQLPCCCRLAHCYLPAEIVSSHGQRFSAAARAQSPIAGGSLGGSSRHSASMQQDGAVFTLRITNCHVLAYSAQPGGQLQWYTPYSVWTLR